MDIDPRRLRFLLAVAREGGVLAAAAALHMTPSAVSQQIARLERETGRMLMTRTPNGSELTAEGATLAEAAQEIERTLTSARTRLERAGSGFRGQMRIGGFQSFLSVVVIPAIPLWKRTFPGINFEIFESERDDLARSLKVGELDAAVFELDAGEAERRLSINMVEVPLLDEPWKLVVPSGTVIADVTDLGRIGLPWLGVEATSASAHAVTRLRRVTGTDLPTVHCYNGIQTALALVAAGEGMTLLPLLALHGMSQNGVDALDVPGLGTRRIVLRSHSRAGRANSLLSTVVTLISESVSHLDFQHGSAGDEP